MAITTNFASQPKLDSAASWEIRRPPVIIAAILHGAKDPPPYSAADREGHEWVVEEMRRGVIPPHHKGQCMAVACRP